MHLSGTDGIHVYRSPGPGKVFENTIHDVGDDAISFGSFYSNEPTRIFNATTTVSQTPLARSKYMETLRIFASSIM
ncbi:hypothetical protein AJ87_37610 [Rhizobium yanglingense]|nr:hypothetical protein AJ87_37610 [Rhizobium yanglingense]